MAQHYLLTFDRETGTGMCKECGLVPITLSDKIAHPYRLTAKSAWRCDGPRQHVMKHRLIEFDPATQTALCKECGPTKIARTSNKYPADTKSGWQCMANRPGKKYRIHVKETCERCGFIPEDLCQLDVHHLNGDHSDNGLENLQTICANCHRLESLTTR